MAFSASQYVAVAPVDNAFRLTGERALNPVCAGDTIVGHGAFEDGTETGPAVLLVLRSTAKHTFSMAPLACQDEYWSSHLSKFPQISARILRNLKDPVPADNELIRRWKLIGTAGSEPEWSDVTFLGKAGVTAAQKTWGFLQDFLVAEGEQPQERWKTLIPPDIYTL